MFYPIILLILSSITHLLFFGQPAAVVFDETYFGTFVNDYSKSSYFFDIHPPFAKLMTKWVGDIIGFPSNINFSTIGNVLPHEVLYLRLLPLIAGLLLPVVIYYICRNLNFSKISAFFVGFILCFENSLIVQSRFILFDSLLLLFGFLSILFYLLYTKHKTNKKFLILSAIFVAFAFSIKWTGLAFPLLIIIYEIVRTKNFKKIAKIVGLYAIVGLVFYLAIFAIHFSYLTHSGDGDAFMSDRFQKTLIGSRYENDTSIKPKGFFGKFIELNLEMYSANKTLTAKHDYSSTWYTWPLMLRPVFYWQNQPEGQFIYLLGNPLIYWLSTIFMMSLLSLTVLDKFRNKTALFICLGFLVNFLPFIFIGRVMFLYHYEAALVFAIIAIAFLLEMIPSEKAKKGIFIGIACLCLITFIFFSPLTYGLKLDDKQLNSRMWLKSWR